MNVNVVHQLRFTIYITCVLCETNLVHQIRMNISTCNADIKLIIHKSIFNILEIERVRKEDRNNKPSTLEIFLHFFS